MVIAAQAMHGLTFGCDPEIFIFDQNNGRYVSPDGIIPGTKSEPYRVGGGAIQQDGMAAEFNIDPVDNYKDFNNNINKVLRTMSRMLPDGHVFLDKPSVVFTPEVWEGASEKAKELGCSPDFNAWTGEVNPPPNPEATPNPMMRTASGHLHFGWTDDANMSDPDHIKNCRDLVKQMDWWLGTWSLNIDPDPTRRLLYGKAGAMRFKPYGVEYRVLSNFWVLKPSARLKVWNRMQAAIWGMKDKFFPETSAKNKFYDFNGAVIKSINESKIDPHLSQGYFYPIHEISLGEMNVPVEAA